LRITGLPSAPISTQPLWRSSSHQVPRRAFSRAASAGDREARRMV
jgi:hypothetical protein